MDVNFNYLEMIMSKIKNIKNEERAIRRRAKKKSKKELCDELAFDSIPFVSNREIRKKNGIYYKHENYE